MQIINNQAIKKRYLNHFYKTLIINKTISVFLLKQDAIRLKKTRKCSLLSDLPCRNLV